MSNYNTLKATINANIKQNGNQEITGQILNSVLNQMVTTLGAGYQFAGVATTATKPGTPDAKVFYIANGKGIYTNFSGLEVAEDEVVVLYYDTEWHKVATGIASQAKLSELAEKVNGKQDALTLTIKDNGNIVIANIQGQSKEFMPATPSGDPMHWAYVAAGAEYNDTGKDIVKDAPWADMLDDNPEDDGTKYGYEYKKVLHKAGCWYLNGIGDLSNNDMVQVYNHTNNFIRFAMDDLTSVYYGLPARTNIIPYKSIWYTVKKGINMRDIIGSSKIEVINFNEYNPKINPITPGNMIGSFAYCASLRFIINAHFDIAKAFGLNQPYVGSPNLIGIFLQNLNKDIVAFKHCGKLSKKSILYMINNEAATSPITITLHADAYARAMADAEILAALEQHTNISLASA